MSWQSQIAAMRSTIGWSILCTLAFGSLLPPPLLMASMVAPYSADGPKSVEKIVSIVGNSNFQLRQLKRDLMDQTLNVYFRLKLDGSLGFKRVSSDESGLAAANLLMAEEFATIMIKQHIIQRRIYTGLKFAFTRLLPMQILKRLAKERPYMWLKKQHRLVLLDDFPRVKGEYYNYDYFFVQLTSSTTNIIFFLLLINFFCTCSLSPDQTKTLPICTH